jgi:hypothetical protein
MHRHLAALTLAGLLVLGVTSARADSDLPRMTRFPTGEVHAGDVIDIAWSKPGKGIEELEIVLESESGRGFTVRVTPELERYRNHYRWKVPEIATDHARLCVRVGEGRDERLALPTPEFRIVARRAPDPAPTVRTAWMLHSPRRPETWDESDAGPVGAAMPALGGESAMSSCDAALRAALVPTRASHDALACLGTLVFLPHGEAALAPPALSQCSTAVPLFLPLRE